MHGFLAYENGACQMKMLKALEQERRARKLETVPETVRSVLGEYLKTKT
jgi:hypothetical protein